MEKTELGSLDIITYITLKKYFNHDKNKKFTKLIAWFDRIKEKVDQDLNSILQVFSLNSFSFQKLVFY